jgi:hypothetical protein
MDACMDALGKQLDDPNVPEGRIHSEHIRIFGDNRFHLDAILENLPDSTYG